ncbi:MAG: hypothetical protein JWO89_1799 [Verrucomicrobiaceae bacterium]|nr:hypothetical protein [Verrucomicrobiaceae bacterium]MDB6116339.1 hypothetical protein [Verrucomicrobiaceae bacterium]
MINVSLSELILLSMALGLAIVVIGWLVSSIRVRRRELQRRKGVVLCRICGVRYEGGNEDMTICPACETPNESRPPDLI